MTDELITALDRLKQQANLCPPFPWTLSPEHDEVWAADGEVVCIPEAFSGNQVRNTARHIVNWEPGAVLDLVARLREVIKECRYIAENGNEGAASMARTVLALLAGEYRIVGDDRRIDTEQGKADEISVSARESGTPVPAGNKVEHAQLMSDGGMHVRWDDPEAERIYPLNKWIKGNSRGGGRVFRRTIVVIEDWTEVTDRG